MPEAGDGTAGRRCGAAAGWPGGGVSPAQWQEGWRWDHAGASEPDGLCFLTSEGEEIDKKIASRATQLVCWI